MGGLAALSPVTFLLVYEQQKSFREVVEAGALARAVQTLLLHPFEMLRTCHQSGALLPEKVALHFSRGAWEIGTTDGWRSMWRGLIPTLLRDVPFSVFFWGSYIGLGRHAGLCSAAPPSREASFSVGFPDEDDIQGRESLRPNPLGCALLASVCGAGAALATQPFDVVKTKMQAHQLIKSDRSGYRKVTVPRVTATFQEVYAMAGVRGLFTGSLARMLSASVGGLLLGPLFLFGQVLAEDSSRPLRTMFVIPEDPSRTIVHPRSYRSLNIEIGGKPP